MRKELSVLYSQEKALRPSGTKEKEFFGRVSNPRSVSKKGGSSDLQAVIDRVSKVSSWKSNETEGKKHDYLAELAAGAKRTREQELAWAVMNAGAAKGVINRVGPRNLLGTYKALGSDIILGSHGYMAIGPEMRAAGMTFRDIKRILSIAEKGRPKALDWKAVHAVDDIRKVFDPRWSTFENKIKLYKLLFNGHRINGVHWRDVADLLESGYTKGYRPGDMMNILRIDSDHLHPNGALHGTYDVGIRGSNEGLFPGKVNIRDFYRSTYNRGVGNTTRSLQLGGKYEPDARAIERIISGSKDVRP